MAQVLCTQNTHTMWCGLYTYVPVFSTLYIKQIHCVCHIFCMLIYIHVNKNDLFGSDSQSDRLISENSVFEDGTCGQILERMTANPKVCILGSSL